MGELEDRLTAVRAGRRGHEGQLFIDRIEDNGVAVLIGPDGSKHDVPAQRGWKEGQFIAPPAAPKGRITDRDAQLLDQRSGGAGFYLTPPTGMDPREPPPGPNPSDTSAFHLAPPTGMDPTASAPVTDIGGRKADTATGQFIDNHQPVPPTALRESQPWNWYGAGPVPNPTPPMRLPTDVAGPAPPVGAKGAGGAGGMSMMSMPSERGRARRRRSRPVP